jgi:hypothetical protein
MPVTPTPRTFPFAASGMSVPRAAQPRTLAPPAAR